MTTTHIMINGVPGKVATTILAHAINDERFTVVPYSLTGPDTEKSVRVNGTDITLVSPEERSAVLKTIKETYGPFVTVDYTHPSAVDANVAFYCAEDLPFVMGTTGGNREQIRADVTDSAIPAVIAPNMAKQIVGLQAMIEYGAKNFPGLFKDFQMTVKESHQSWKADTSGTAKAIIRQFNLLGVEFTEADIDKVREPEAQKAMGIPEEHLDGHGWHTYTLCAPDGSSEFGITHNINGRDIYAEGTLDAVAFVEKKRLAGIKGHCFSMIDVLKNL
ncbi:dihydrodipicolinate reductase C-terminal domain-containing protein [Desulfoluna spongiiphila]|uniref:dihydrodipicolinate reductase C-terminal domain-containing protein n=1 Tax=Desulfoluna spongiiphila TaxID=419481 RepID=UPI001256924B|nr:dihydrodipicolinate reductase C-terminal domain-containing protein [Desulfoluna spongiiphila]VVS93958.1 dihydrodipicolinate reductase [Desulfoluna spongiiphila]